MDKSFKYFIGVIQAGNISGAAKKLRISQPALSTSLKSLEAQLKTELFVRSRKGVTLTPTGTKVYKHALELEDIEKNMYLSLNESKKGNLKLEIGAIDSIAHQIVSQIISEKGFSQITVDNSERLINKVKNGQLEAAYVTKPEHTFRELGYKLIAHEKMIAVATKKFDCPFPLLAYNADSNTHRHIALALKKAGLKSKTILHSTDPQILLEAARLGRGVAIIPKSLFDASQNPNLIHTIKKLKISRPIVEVSRQARYSPEILNKLKNRIIQSLK